MTRTPRSSTSSAPRPRSSSIARSGRRDRPSRTAPSVAGALPALTVDGTVDSTTTALGAVAFEPDRTLRTVAWSAADVSTWEFALVGVLFVLICALFVLRLSEAISTSPGDDRDRPTPEDLVCADDSRWPPDGATEASPGHVSAKTATDQDRVLRFLVESGGRIRQQEIVERTEWSKSKVSRLLSRMEENGTIEKVPVGRENVIRLASSDSKSNSHSNSSGPASPAVADHPVEELE